MLNKSQNKERISEDEETRVPDRKSRLMNSCIFQIEWECAALTKRIQSQLSET